MHELTMINQIFGLIEEVAKEHDIEKVTRVKLQVGELRQFIPSMLHFAFEAVSKGTVAQGAQLDIDYIPIKVRCKNCDNTFDVKEQTYICPICDGCDLDIVTGKEVILETVEGDT